MPKFAKGSQEAKDAMAKARASRGKPKDPTKPKRLTKKQAQREREQAGLVMLEKVGDNEVVVPQYYAKQLAPSKKKKLRYRLVNPITQERKLATRNGQSVVQITRRPTKETILLGSDPTPIPLSAFSRADQEKVKEQFKAVSVFGDREPNEMPKIPLDKPKPRGRPTKLPKNIEWWKENAGTVRMAKKAIQELKTAKDKAKAEREAKKKPAQPKPEPKPNISMVIEEGDEDEDEDKAEEKEEKKEEGGDGNMFLPEPMKPATATDVKDLKTFLEDLKTEGEKGLDYYPANGIFGDIVFAGILSKYGNKCFWERDIATEGKSVGDAWTNIKVIFTEEKMNDNKMLTSIFTPSFIEQFGKHIEGCMERGEEIIAIPLTLYGYTVIKEKNTNALGGYTPNKQTYDRYVGNTSSHANMLIFRPKRGIVERFEPHGSKSGLAEKIDAKSEIVINKVLKRFWEKEMKKYVGKVRFVPPIDICPTKYPQTAGFQSLASMLGKDIYGDKYMGFCLMWSLFFVEVILMNPDKTTDEVITETLAISKEDPDYLLQVIKGYVRMAEIIVQSMAESAGLKDYKLTLEKEDRNSPLYQGLFANKSKVVKERLGEYFTSLYESINTGTKGEKIEKSKKAEEATVASKYEDIEKQFKEGGELDKLKRAFKSIKMSKPVFNALYDVFTSNTESIKKIYEDYFKSRNFTAEEIQDYKYKLFADMLVDKDQVKRRSTTVNKFLTFIETNFAGNKRAGTVLKQAKKQREELGKFLLGKGILDDIKGFYNKGVKAVKRGYDDAKDFASTVISGRKDYQPKGRDIVKRYGAETIKAIEVGRDPVLPALKGVLNAISGGEFGKRVDKAEYDDLFHLFAVITLASGKKIMTEKNEVIIISESIPARSEKAEYIQIANIPSITMETLFSNNKSRMGGKYFTYSAKDNNCQDYLLSLLKSSGIGTEAEYKFIKQDTKQLFEGMPGLRKFANSITGFAGKLDVILAGRGFADKETEAEIEDIEGYGLAQKKICCNCIKGMVHTCEMCGGKISSRDVEKFFRNVGKKIIGKKATKKVEKFGEDAGKYITAKKGGLATDLIDYGVPAATAAVVGGLSGLATGGLGGVVGSAAGSKLGKEVIAPALHKATGAGMGGRSAWITLVKKVAREKGISYKEALSVASAMRKK